MREVIIQNLLIILLIFSEYICIKNLSSFITIFGEPQRLNPAYSFCKFLLFNKLLSLKKSNYSVKDTNNIKVSIFKKFISNVELRKVVGGQNERKNKAKYLYHINIFFSDYEFMFCLLWV